jgi:hypothetical protein
MGRQQGTVAKRERERLKRLKATEKRAKRQKKSDSIPEAAQPDGARRVTGPGQSAVEAPPDSQN